MRELTEAEQAREVARIEGPWPMKHVLPMKNLYSSQLGFTFRSEDASWVVYHGNLQEVLGTPIAAWTLPKVSFDSTEAMVRAGWVGD